MQSPDEYQLRLPIVDIHLFKKAIEDQSISLIFFLLKKNPALWRWYTGQVCEIVDVDGMKSQWMTIFGTDLVTTFRSLLSIGEEVSTIINYIFNHNIALQNWYSGLAIPNDINGKYISSRFQDLVDDFHLALTAKLDKIIEFMWSRIPTLCQWYRGTNLSVLNDEAMIRNTSIQFPNLIKSFKLASNRHPEIANAMLNGLLVLYSETIFENQIYQLSIINEVFDNYIPEQIEHNLTIRFLKLIDSRELLEQVKKYIQFGLNYKTVYKEQKIDLIEDRLIGIDEEMISHEASIIPAFQTIERIKHVPISRVNSVRSTKSLIDLMYDDPKILLHNFRKYLRDGNCQKLINLWYSHRVDNFYRHDSSQQPQLMTFEEVITDFRLALKIGSKISHEIWKINQQIREYYDRDSKEMIYEINQIIDDFRLALANEAEDIVSAILNKLPVIGLLYYSQSLGYYKLSLSDIIQDIEKAFKLNIKIFINILLSDKEKLGSFLQNLEYRNAYRVFSAAIDSHNENRESFIEFFGENLPQMKRQYNSNYHQDKKLQPISNQMTIPSIQSDDTENQSNVSFSHPIFNYQTNINIFNFTFLSSSVSQSSQKEKEEITILQPCQDASKDMDISFNDYLTEEDYTYIDSMLGN